jgi:hypothetical protein
MAFQKRTYVGKGKWYIKEYGAEAPLLFVGNVSEATFNHEETKVSVPDFTESGGGEYDSVRRIDAVTLQLTKWDILNPDNLARLLRGSVTAQTSLTPIVDEAHTAYQGGLIQFDRIPDPDVSITVTGPGSAAYTTADYTRTPAGILIKTTAEGGNIADETEIEISYTPLASDTVEAMTVAGKRYTLVFEGLNEADEDRPVLINVHLFKPGVATAMSWISNEFLSAPFTGDVLKDTSITGPTLSKYYKVTSARPA